MKSSGLIHRTVVCPCGTEVRFRYSWDRSVGWAAVEDTEHLTPAGEPCNLPDSEVEQALEDGGGDEPDREDP